MGSQCAKPKSKGMIHSRKTKVGVSPLLAQKNANKSLSFCEPSNLLNSKMPSLENVPNIESLDTLSVRSKSLTTECAYEESPKLIAFGSPAKPNTLPIFDDTEIRNTAQYKKGPLVGKGCYGEVYECLNLSSGELHAAKSVKAYGNMGKFYNYIEAIRKEITVLKTLCHPNVVKYFAMDISEVKEDNYTIIDIISEYVSGGSIKVLLDKFDKLDERVISHYTKQILEGLAYLHSNDIVHRNIKSSNVLIDACGTAKLADFGCFKNLDKFVCTNSPEKNNIYHLSAKLKFCWEAPEVLLKKSQGKSADIWSVGCVVLEMLTGLPPWKVVDSNLANVFKMISLGELPDLPENISDNCRDFLLKVFKFKAEERPSAVELLDHPFIREQIPSISCLDYESMHTFQIHQTLMGATSLDFLQDEIFAGEKRHQENKYNRCEDPSINVHCTEQPHIKKINELSIHVGQSKAIPNHLNKPAPALPGLMRFGSKTSIEDPKESKSTAVPSLMRFGSRTSIEDVKEMKNNWETAKTPGRRNETEFDYGTCNSLSTASKTMISEETMKIGSQTSIIQTPIKNTFFFSPNVTMQEKNQSGKKVENNHTITPSSFHNSRAGIEKEKIIWDREAHNSPKDQKDLRKKLEEDMIKELAEIDMDGQNHEEKLESELQREISSPRTLEQEKNEMRKRFEQEMEQELNGVEISQFDR